MRRFGRRGALAVAITATLSAPALAADHLQDALKLILRDASTGSRLTYVTKVPVIGMPTEQPYVVGATLTIKALSGETATLQMPADGGWSTNSGGTLHRFINKLAPGGPSEVKLALIKAGTVLKVVAKSSGITLDEDSQDSISVILEVGGDRWCSTCDLISIRQDEVGKFIARRGPGLHHVCLAVPDIEKALAELTGKGFRLLNRVPVPGAVGKRIAFLHPEAGHGVLLELSEDPAGAR